MPSSRRRAPSRLREPRSRAVARSLLPPGRLGLRLREVLLALPQQDRLALDEVAYADLAGGDLSQRPVAAVVGEPGGAAARGGREAADGAEGALAAAPQVTDGPLGEADLLAAQREQRPLKAVGPSPEAAAEQVQIRE